MTDPLPEVNDMRGHGESSDASRRAKEQMRGVARERGLGVPGELPEITWLRRWAWWRDPHRVSLVDAEQAVRDADARARREERERLTSDEAVEAAARAIAGPARCFCDDDWRVEPFPRCPKHGDGRWPDEPAIKTARAALRAVLVGRADPEGGTDA